MKIHVEFSSNLKAQDQKEQNDKVCICLLVMVKYTWTISDNGQIEFGNLQRSQKLKFVWLYVIQPRISLKCLTTILTNNNCSETLKVPPDQGYSDFLSTNFVPHPPPCFTISSFIGVSNHTQSIIDRHYQWSHRRIILRGKKAVINSTIVWVCVEKEGITTTPP